MYIGLARQVYCVGFSLNSTEENSVTSSYKCSPTQDLKKHLAASRCFVCCTALITLMFVCRLLTMAYWARVQQLQGDAMRTVQGVYGPRFPIEVRHYCASWIEQQPW
jgi:hypothetical protein